MEGNSPYITNLVNSIIGVSVLAMPFCLKQCGIILGLGLLSCAAYLTYLSCSMLTTSAFHKRRRTYEYLALYTLGPTGKFTVELSMIGMMLGTCVAFYIVIGDLSNGVLSKFIVGADPHMLRTYTIVFTALCIALPLGMMKNLAIISYFGFFSLTFYGAFLIVVILNAISNGLFSWEWLNEVNLWRPSGIFQCLPIFSLAYACHCQLFIVYNSLEDPSVRRIEDIVSGAIKLVTIVYMSVGFFGYTTYRDHIAGNLLVSFPSNLLLDFIKLGFAMSVVLGFPLMISPCRQSIHTLFFAKPAGEGLPINTYIPPFLFKSITLTIVISTMTIAILIPNVETILGLTGATMGSIICFIFPALIYEKASPKATGSVPKFVFTLGCMLLVICTYSNLANTGQSVETPAEAPIVPKDHDLPINDPPDVPKEPFEQPGDVPEGHKPPEIEEDDKENEEEKPKLAEVVNDEHRHEPANPVDPDNPGIDSKDDEEEIHVEEEKKDEIAKEDADKEEGEKEEQDSPKDKEEVHNPVDTNDAHPVQDKEEPANVKLPDKAEEHEAAGNQQDQGQNKDPKPVEKVPEDHVRVPAEEVKQQPRVSPKIIRKDDEPLKEKHEAVVGHDQAAPGAAIPGNQPKAQNAQNILKQDEGKAQHDAEADKELLEKIKEQHGKQQQLLKEQEQLIKELEEHQDKKEQVAAEGEGGQPYGEEDVHQQLEGQKLDQDQKQVEKINDAQPRPQLGAVGDRKLPDPKIEAPKANVAIGDGVLAGRGLLSDNNGGNVDHRVPVERDDKVSNIDQKDNGDKQHAHVIPVQQGDHVAPVQRDGFQPVLPAEDKLPPLDGGGAAHRDGIEPHVQQDKIAAPVQQHVDMPAAPLKEVRAPVSHEGAIRPQVQNAEELQQEVPQDPNKLSPDKRQLDFGAIAPQDVIPRQGMPQDVGHGIDFHGVQENIDGFADEHRAARKERDVSNEELEMIQDDSIIKGEIKNLGNVASKMEVSEQEKNSQFKQNEEEEGRGLSEDSQQGLDDKQDKIELNDQGMESEECLATDHECWQAKAKRRDLKSVNNENEF